MKVEAFEDGSIVQVLPCLGEGLEIPRFLERVAEIRCPTGFPEPGCFLPAFKFPFELAHVYDLFAVDGDPGSAHFVVGLVVTCLPEFNTASDRRRESFLDAFFELAPFHGWAF